MTEAASLSVTLAGRDVGLSTLLQAIDTKTKAAAVGVTALEAQLAKLAQAQGGVASSGGAVVAGLTTTGTSSRTAATNVVALQQAEARLLATQGDLPGAANKLTAALNTQNITERQAIAVKTQLAQVQNRISGQTQPLTSLFQQQNTAIAGLGQQFSTAGSQAGGMSTLISGLGGQLSGLGGNVGSLAGSIGQLAGSFGTLGAIGAVIGISKVGLDMAQTSATIDGTRQSFDALAISAGTTGDILLGSLRAAAQGTVSDAKLIESANSGILLTGGKLASDLPKLLEIARASARASGDDIGFVFDSLVKGIARGSPQIIDNAKITLNASAAMETYAASIGKIADQLTSAEKQQATLNAVLAAGDDIIKKTGGSVQNNATTFAQFGVNIENAKNSFGSFIASGLAPLAGQFNETATATGRLTTFLSQVGTAASASQAQLTADAAANTAYAQTLAQTNSEVAATAAAENARAESLRQSASSTVTATAAVTAMSSADAAAAQAARDHAIAIQQLAELTGQIAPAVNVTATAELAYANSLEMVGVQARAAALAAQQKADSDQVGAVNAQTAAVGNQFLAQAAQQAAGALIASGSAGARAAALLANSSSQIDVLTAAYYRLQAAQIAAGNAANKASVNQTIAQNRAAGRSGRGDSSDAGEVSAANVANQAKIKDALDDQIRANGSNAQKIALANRNLQEQVRLHGANSAAAIRAQTALDSAVESGTKKAKGAGGTKLSDQTKLNNSLLTQQEDYQNKAEDAAQQHADAVAKIEADFAAKILAQQKLNEVSKLNSQADFYDRLTGSELNKKKSGAAALKQLDDQYQKDFQKSQELAQAGSPKLAADFLALKQKQAEQELSFQEKLAEAKEKGDKGEVSRLQAIQELRRRAAAEEEKQLLAGGDQDVNAKNKALDDAAQKEADAQEKIGAASDRATAKKIQNAELAGKKVDEELTKVNALSTAYAGLGGRSPLASGTSATPPATATQAAAGGGASTDISGALDSLRSAISAVEAAVSKGSGNVVSAVRGIHLSAPGVG